MPAPGQAWAKLVRVQVEAIHESLPVWHILHEHDRARKMLSKLRVAKMFGEPLKQLALNSCRWASCRQDSHARFQQQASRPTNSLIIMFMPFGRAAEPDEVADLAVFLASDRASYISGVVMTLDGEQAARHYTIRPAASFAVEGNVRSGPLTRTLHAARSKRRCCPRVYGRKGRNHCNRSCGAPLGARNLIPCGMTKIPSAVSSSASNGWSSTRKALPQTNRSLPRRRPASRWWTGWRTMSAFF